MFEYAVDAAVALCALSLATVAALFSYDAVQEYRAWPAMQACHQARVIPDRRPLAATVACLPTLVVP